MRARVSSAAEARLEAELLLGHVAALSRTRLFLDPLLDEDVATRFAALLRERVEAGRPVAQLVGTRGFRDLLLAVDARVLTPRPETEMLIDELFALDEAGQLPAGPLADRGTGSGCLALSAAERRPCFGVDRSADALQVAALNLQRLASGEACEGLDLGEARRRAARVALVQSIGLGALRPGSCAGVLANPPYVLPDEHAELEPEVRVHEPRVALVPTDGDVGAEYARVASEARHALCSGGWLLMEIGSGDGALASSALERAGLTAIHVARDLAGHERMLRARQP